MKSVVQHKFNLTVCEKEFKSLERLLSKKKVLDERKDILPFFKKNKNLLSLVGTLNASISSFSIAHEHSLWGDFQTDFTIADTKTGSYCFIEFENYKSNSIFVKDGKKHNKKYAPRFENGFSQIVDWFCRIDGFKNTGEMKKMFGKEEINYLGILIIGRDEDLDDNLKQRIKWRQHNITIASQKIHYINFNELQLFLKEKIEFLKTLK